MATMLIAKNDESLPKLKQFLADEYGHDDLVHHEHFEMALKQISHQPPAGVIIDCLKAAYEGLEFFKKVRRLNLRIPVTLVVPVDQKDDYAPLMTPECRCHLVLVPRQQIQQLAPKVA